MIFQWLEPTYMRIEPGNIDGSVTKVYPVSLNCILAAGYSNISGGNNWPCASFCLTSLTTESFIYWIFVNDNNFIDIGAYIEKTISVFLIGI